MNIVVIGAGIIGLTSAYALLKAGHQVTVIDSQSAPASGCSHANGSFLSPSHCAPWAAPGVIQMAFKSLFTPASPVKLRWDYSWSQLSWLGAMTRECTATRFQVNRQRMLALGLYSKQCHEKLDQKLGLDYERKHCGILLLCRTPAGQTALQHQAQALCTHGVDAVWLNAEQTLQAEPHLHDKADTILGALHICDEGTGRCEQFSTALAAYLERAGVRFLWQSTVEQLVLHSEASGKQQRIAGIRVQGQTLKTDACVIATGPQAPRLVSPFMKLPVYPVKGYSMTADLMNPHHGPRHALLDEGSKLGIASFQSVVRVAGFAEVVGHDTVLDSARCEQLAQGFEALYPGVADTRKAQFWTGLRPMTPDGTPIIGATSVGGLFLNTGHGTYGWTLSTGSAQLLADTVSGVASALPASDYAVARYGT